jgi:hypothetical protein
MLKYEWAKETQELWRLEEELDRDNFFADSVQVTSYSEYCAKEAVAGTGNFKTGEKVICCVKYADGLVLLAKEETALQRKINWII